MAEPLTVEESKTLLALCRAGKLYEIERWVATGKSVITAPTVKEDGASGRRPATVFHSVVELLAGDKLLEIRRAHARRVYHADAASPGSAR